jgi:hypothetical protein
MTFPTTGRVLAATLIAAAGFALPAAANAKPGDPPTLQDAIGNPSDFKLSGNVRLRYETLDGQARAGLRESEDLVSLRTVVTAEYKTGRVKIMAEVHDSRAFGIEPGGGVGTNEVNTVELVQGNIAFDLADAFGKGSKTSVQAGRMALNIASRRLIASDDYRNTLNSYNGVRMDTALASGFSGTFLYMLPLSRLPENIDALRRGKIQMDRENFDNQLWAAFLNKSKLVGRAMGEIGYVGYAEKDADGKPTRNRHIDNISGRVIADPAVGKLDYEVEGIYQFGSIKASTAASAADLDVSAWFLHADIGYSFPGSLNAHLSFEYDMVSGDGPGGKYGRFDTLYGMRRGDFVPSGIYSAIGRANISAPGLRMEVRPSKVLDGFFAYHPMWLANRYDAFSTTGVKDATGASGNFAGHLFDGRVRWWAVPKFLRAEVNGGYIIKGGFLKNAPNAPKTGDTRYGAVSLTANF